MDSFNGMIWPWLSMAGPPTEEGELDAFDEFNDYYIRPYKKLDEWVKGGRTGPEPKAQLDQFSRTSATTAAAVLHWIKTFQTLGPVYRKRIPDNQHVADKKFITSLVSANVSCFSVFQDPSDSAGKTYYFSAYNPGKTQIPVSFKTEVGDQVKEVYNFEIQPKEMRLDKVVYEEADFKNAEKRTNSKISTTKTSSSPENGTRLYLQKKSLSKGAFTMDFGDDTSFITLPAYVLPPNEEGIVFRIKIKGIPVGDLSKQDGTAPISNWNVYPDSRGIQYVFCNPGDFDNGKLCDTPDCCEEMPVKPDDCNNRIISAAGQTIAVDVSYIFENESKVIEEFTHPAVATYPGWFLAFGNRYGLKVDGTGNVNGRHVQGDVPKTTTEKVEVTVEMKIWIGDIIGKKPMSDTVMDLRLGGSKLEYFWTYLKVPFKEVTIEES